MNAFYTYALITFLILCSGLFSGLTLGLLGLDMTGLEVVIGGSDPIAARNARVIAPVRKKGNQLLCTLLLGNVAVNTVLSILMADIAGGLTGGLVSTAVIVVFGEIIPQASCSRYALQIGAASIPLVNTIMFLFFPLSYPMAMLLDKVLGDEIGNIHSKSEMKRLLELHVENGAFDDETGKTMAGALTFKDLEVRTVMTPLEDVYMISIEEVLSFETVAEIFKSGFSRIPVYEIDEENICGLLLVKDLIFVDPEDGVSVRNFTQIFGRGLHVVWPDQNLGECLKTFKMGRGHMALVRGVEDSEEGLDPVYKVKGIITLEDIIEEILGAEIVDETDVFIDVDNHVKVDRRTFDWARLRLLDARAVDKTLSADEVKAASAHLLANHGEVFGLLSDTQLKTMIASTAVSEIDADGFKEAWQGQVDNIDGYEVIEPCVLYKRGIQASFCTLILTGKMIVLAGKDRFRADAGAWKVLGTDALLHDVYEPDFSAFVSCGREGGEGSKIRCLKIARSDFAVGLAATTVEQSPTLVGQTRADPAFSITLSDTDTSVGEADDEFVSIDQKKLRKQNSRRKEREQMLNNEGDTGGLKMRQKRSDSDDGLSSDAGQGMQMKTFSKVQEKLVPKPSAQAKSEAQALKAPQLAKREVSSGRNSVSVSKRSSVNSGSYIESGRGIALYDGLSQRDDGSGEDNDVESQKPPTRRRSSIA